MLLRPLPPFLEAARAKFFRLTDSRVSGQEECQVERVESCKKEKKEVRRR